MMGLARENLGLTEEEMRLLACHESGHAFVAAVLPHAGPIHKLPCSPSPGLPALSICDTLFKAFVVVPWRLYPTWGPSGAGFSWGGL